MVIYNKKSNELGKKFIILTKQKYPDKKIPYDYIHYLIGMDEAPIFQIIVSNFFANGCKECTCKFDEIKCLISLYRIKKAIKKLCQTGVISITKRGNENFYNVNFEVWQSLIDEFNKEIKENDNRTI